MQRLPTSFVIIITGLFILTATTVYSPMNTHAHAHHPYQQKYAIFDLHGVLIRTTGEFQMVGLGTFLRYAWHELPNPLTMKNTIKKLFFGFLNTVQPMNNALPIALDADGTPLPQIMCDWLTGSQSTATILQKIELAAHHHPNQAQANLLLAISRMTFNPKLFIATQEWVPEALELAQDLKDRGYKIYILSNWDPESFALLQDYYPEVFAQFHGVVISGTAQSIKPDVAPGNIYEQLIARYNIDPKHTIFIDDLNINVQAAHTKYGIHGILCPQNRLFTKPWAKYPNIAQVRKAVDTWELCCKPQQAPEVIAH